MIRVWATSPLSLPLDFSVDNLAGGDSLGGAYTLTMPAQDNGTSGDTSDDWAVGDYSIFVHVDGSSVGDTVTTNDIASILIPIGPTSPSGSTLPELSVEKFYTPEVDKLAWGETYPAEAMIMNRGDAGISGSVNVSVFISPMPMLVPGRG